MRRLFTILIILLAASGCIHTRTPDGATDTRPDPQTMVLAEIALQWAEAAYWEYVSRPDAEADRLDDLRARVARLREVVAALGE